MRCTIVTIGTELLIGQVIDTNSAFIGEKMNELGIEIASRISVADKKHDMLNAFIRATDDADLVIVTGGLGPTNDDITKKVIAEFLGVDMYFDENQFSLIQAFFEKLGRKATEAHKNQCFFPFGTSFLENKLGTAQGMLIKYKDKTIICLPGVPYEMKYIVNNGIIPLLKTSQSAYIFHKTIQTSGIGETDLADKIVDIESKLPENMDLAYLPSLGKVRVRVSGKSNNKLQIEEQVNRISDEISSRFGKYVFGYNEDDLSSTIGILLKERNLTLGLAESCTGGMIASQIVQVPGSSAYFEGGLVTYSDRLKHEILGVKLETLEMHGAVSEEVVKEMVIGTLSKLDVDVALSVSGIAGPTGGTDEKPVGTIWMCIGNKDQMFTRKIQTGRDRSKNIEYTSNLALNLIRLFLTDNLN